MTFCFLKLYSQADQAKADTRPVIAESRTWAGVPFAFVLLPGMGRKGKEESRRFPLGGDRERVKTGLSGTLGFRAGMTWDMRRLRQGAGVSSRFKLRLSYASEPKHGRYSCCTGKVHVHDARHTRGLMRGQTAACASTPRCAHLRCV